MAVRQIGRENKAMSNQAAARTPARGAGNDLMNYLREYARENPEATALWCLGVGFVLGWKLKPW